MFYLDLILSHLLFYVFVFFVLFLKFIIFFHVTQITDFKRLVELNGFYVQIVPLRKC